MQIFKHFVRKGEESLQQIARRYSEYNIHKKDVQVLKISFAGIHTVGPLVNSCCSPQFKCFSLSDGISLNISKEADSFCSVIDSTIILCENFTSSNTDNNEMMVIGKKFLHMKNVMPPSFPSLGLGCFHVYGLSSLKCWPVNKIKQKYIALPFENGHGYVSFTSSLV